MEPKLHSSVSITFIQSILFLEHPSTIGNSKLTSTKERKTIFKRKSLDDLTAKVNTIMVGARPAGTTRSRCTVMIIGNGVVKSNNPILLIKNGGSLQLTEDWARGVLKSMNWVKRKGTTEKSEPAQQFLLEEKLTF